MVGRKVIVAAVVAAGALVGGIAWAAIPDAGGVIHGCYINRLGTLRVIDAATQRCTALETPLQWNAQGPQGLQGVPGQRGDKGDPGTSVESAALAPGDANCPNGGSQFIAANATTYACNGASSTGRIFGSTKLLADRVGTITSEEVLRTPYFEIHGSCVGPQEDGEIGGLGLHNASSVLMDHVVWNGQNVGTFQGDGQTSVDTGMDDGQTIQAQLHWIDGHTATVWVSITWQPGDGPLGVGHCSASAMGIVS